MLDDILQSGGAKSLVRHLDALAAKVRGMIEG